ncbi:MAG: hypothetical protein AAF989_16595 [Planctomycetota bacterium]
MTRTYCRTNATNLSDADLRILDFLFQFRRASQESLSREQFRLIMNCEASHDLSSESLAESLKELVERRMIWKRDSSRTDEPVFTMTARGGEAWESERCPAWDTFIDTWRNPAGSTQCVIATREEFARYVLGVHFAHGLIVPIGKIKVRAIRQRQLVPWRRSGYVFVARVRIQSGLPMDHAGDREALGQRRIWWQTVDELDELNRKGS